MTIYIALLRGINVGGHNVIKMKDLRNSFETMGFGNVKTYIQSGNVLFESSEEADILCKRMEQEIQDTFGFSGTVILRTAMELEKIIKNCPFQADTLSEGEGLYISFLSEAPSREAINQVLINNSETEECKIIGTEVYLFLRQSIRNSKLTTHLKKLKVLGTLRNWKTINKLVMMARAMG
ncbi:DUF1697 domain-containing protein [Bacillus sp. FSL K6-3431]|uniref:DUF1697 domain-containing protein n=1 Tax=Bacillus sp. FSL K6-3431 TaxID=2921500 RepID=UPI0030FB51B2